jgi:predicted ATPase/class 3 adenylate cyclase
MTSNLPTGTVTFLFTDIEGSTKLAQEHPAEMPLLLARHHEILSRSIEAHNGYVFLIVGDSFCAAFRDALDAVQAALATQRSLSAEIWGEIEPLRVRMGLHTGAAQFTEDGQYSGYITLAAVQRIMSAGHGGQVLISRSTRELVHDVLPAGAELSDLGERRLKDLLHPEHLYQLNISGLPSTFPPLRTLDAFPNNLPEQLTSFIGREHEIAEIKQELAAHRLITLTGSGGTGKTRLALQAAAELLDHFNHGIWFIELAPLTDPDLIPQAILSEIGVIEGQGRQPLDALKEYLHHKKSLLILDNCEHLISACAQVVNALLSAASGLKVLATSREALGLKGELAYPVPSLSLPDPKHLPPIEQLLQIESVRLFVDRALLAAPHFALDGDNAPFIAQICCRLDGIPLAIELAAARVKVLSAEQISNRLADRFRLLTGGARTALPRQRTLRALIDWSYDLLADPERLFLLRLSVFAGGWSLEAAEQICAGDGIDAYDILDLLSQLVNKSLVVVVEQPRSAETRYRILETIRQYASEKLLESGSGVSIHDRHLDYYLQLVKRAELEFYGPNDLPWLVILEGEWDNLRAAVEWSLEIRPRDGLELVKCLVHFIEQHWHVSDIQNWLSQLVPDPHNSARTATRARGLLGWALCLCIGIGTRKENISSVRLMVDEGLSIYEELDDKRGIARALLERGWMCAWMGEPHQGILFLEQALALARETGDKLGIANALLWLGFATHTHETPRKLAYLQESLSIYRELKYVTWMIENLKQLGAIELRRGNFEAAHTWLDEALSILQGHASSLGTFMTVSYDVGDLAFYEGNYALAQKYYQDCLAWAERAGSSVSIGYANARLGYLYLRLGDLQNAADYLRQALMIFQPLAHTHGVTFTLEGIASLAVKESRWKEAALLLAYASKQYEQNLGPRPFVEQKDVEKDLAVVHSQLSEAEWTVLSAQGRSMTMEQAIQSLWSGQPGT